MPEDFATDKVNCIRPGCLGFAMLIEEWDQETHYCYECQKCGLRGRAYSQYSTYNPKTLARGSFLNGNEEKGQQ